MKGGWRKIKSDDNKIVKRKCKTTAIELTRSTTEPTVESTENVRSHGLTAVSTYWISGLIERGLFCACSRRTDRPVVALLLWMPRVRLTSRQLADDRISLGCSLLRSPDNITDLVLLTATPTTTRLDDNAPRKGAWSESHDLFSITMPAIISPERLKRQSPNFVCR